MPEEMFYPGHPYRGRASLLQKRRDPCRSERAAIRLARDGVLTNAAQSAIFRSAPFANKRISAHKNLQPLLNRASRFLAQLLL